MAQQFKAWISKDLAEHGMAWAILVRERTTGWCEVAVFLVDLWCLGVKDAYCLERATDGIDEMLDEQLPADLREEIEPACLRALVEGAVAHAQSLGFLPHRDYRKARRIFGSLKATDCARTYAFGRDGRPCFVAGPDDDQARINRVLAILTSRVGPDGFDFIDTVEAEEEATEPLFRFIEEGRSRGRALTRAGALGFLTGLWIQPDLIKPSEWLTAFWGGDATVPGFQNEDEARAVIGALMALYNEIGESLRRGDYAVGLPAVGESDRGLFATRHSEGVLCGLGLRPKVVAWLRGHPEGGPQIALLERCARGEVAADEALEDRLVDAIEHLCELAGELPRLDPPPA